MAHIMDPPCMPWGQKKKRGGGVLSWLAQAGKGFLEEALGLCTPKDSDCISRKEWTVDSGSKGSEPKGRTHLRGSCSLVGTELRGTGGRMG